jgi:uncharacterized membrane protein YesL
MCLMLFFGLGVAGFAVLVFSVFRACSRRAYIRWGVLGGVFMLLQCLLMLAAAVFVAMFGPNKPNCWPAIGAALFFVLCLKAYFAMTPRRRR